MHTKKSFEEKECIKRKGEEIKPRWRGAEEVNSFSMSKKKNTLFFGRLTY